MSEKKAKQSSFEVYEDYLSAYEMFNPITAKDYTKKHFFLEREYKEFLPRNKNIKILDLACGVGYFLHFLEAKGYKNLVGVDCSTSQIETAKKHLQSSKIILDDVNAFLKQNDEKYDRIFFMDLLEHLPKDDIVEFLTLVRGNLNEDGLAIGTAINAASPLSMNLRYQDFTNLVSFTEVSFNQIYRKAGFTDMHFRARFPYVRPLFFPLFYCYKNAIKCILESKLFALPNIDTKNTVW